MSLIYRRRPGAPSLTGWVHDYRSELGAFARRTDGSYQALPLLALKSIEWAIYRWYRTPIRRFYGVRGNELIYMLTRRCGDRCAKCGIWKDPESDAERLPAERFIDCLRRLHENLYQLTITGGEPLLFAEDVLLIGEEAKRLGIPMVVVSNGSQANEGFLRRFAALGHRLVISLDTVDPDQWVAFRGRDHHAQVMRNVEAAVTLLGSRLRVQSVLASESANDVMRVADFCRERRIHHTIQPYMDFGGTWHGLPPGGSKSAVCAARKNICIYPNGDVVKCFDHRRIPIAREPLGNIGREDIIHVLSTRRSTEVSRAMKACELPCRQLSCNLPVVLDGP